jgi:hypothetical protein
MSGIARRTVRLSPDRQYDVGPTRPPKLNWPITPPGLNLATWSADVDDRHAHLLVRYVGDELDVNVRQRAAPPLALHSVDGREGRQRRHAGRQGTGDLRLVASGQRFVASRLGRVGQ